MLVKMAVPQYREEQLLGIGGMAEVWRAHGPQGPVALKRLLPHAARSPSLVAAFEREGRLLARIAHPNVIGIREILRDERGTCLVLEYVEGSDLAVDLGTVPTNVALRIVRDVLSALEAVHELRDEGGHLLGLIHRDLSPANVLVGIDGRVKLTDFGIARSVSGSLAKTTGQTIKGTLAYLAPEQARGAPADARVDLFAAGALLYEMLAGKPIYDEADPRLALAMARAGDVPSLSCARPDLPIAIVEFVDRSLAASPANRFPDAASMRKELERVAASTSGLARDEDLVAFIRPYVKSTVAPSSRTSVTTIALASKSRRAKLGVAMGVGLFAMATVGSLLRGAAKEGRSSGLPVSIAAAPAASMTVEPAPSSNGTTVPTVDEREGERSEAFLPSSSSSRATSGKSPPADRRTKSTRPPVGSSGSPATRVQERSTASSAQKGTLDIGSEPAFAYVTIDGVMVGPTPLFDREIAAGSHRIQVAREGLGSKTFVLEVRPGERIRRVIKLP